MLEGWGEEGICSYMGFWEDLCDPLCPGKALKEQEWEGGDFPPPHLQIG